MNWIVFLLAFSAGFCAVMYVRGWVIAWPVLNKANRSAAEQDFLIHMENHTFHLGLCFILSLGFVGVIA